MNLKEAFRYQNKLTEWTNETNEYLTYDQNVTKKTQEHMRKKVNPNAIDEIIDTTKDRQCKYPVDSLVDFLVKILEIKQTLTNSIYTAKIKSGIDLDGAVCLNKKRQEVSSTLSRMSNIKPSDHITKGTDYKFNVAGDQTSYTYEIKEVTEIDFDRNKIRAIAKKLIKNSDEISAKLDKMMIDVEVDYIPVYDVNDTYEDVLEQFCTVK
jgi:hypothetical protein